ncbi:hypothetical protein Ppa06_62380 [Planomonospora parontospora subsp. parontospora]|uniref:Uncharacterized protein n=2 Tax=Planomonospora parontospora TaxID=58119 RepID=A0AA37BC01_9ACTN|nr:hypothetical protein [Planomonospora parontospora]GGK49203.1 hypothetical protein GCM10010126_06020 [Planomonospora parontospora]GII12440.1 hypothetical protein Ppa06_62380 [Planomonospora parontospora subsp. parontospora]
MDDPRAGHPSDRREEARLEFREAGRELRWAMGRYGDARQAIDSGGVSIGELFRARQAWAWALMEWVRTLTSREEVLDGVRSGPGDGSERPDAGAGRFPPPATLEAARRQVEVLSGQYERVRHRASPDEVALARSLWARALASWARMLIAAEEAADGVRLDRLEAGDQVGAALSGEDPPGRTERSARQREVVTASRERARAANLAARGYLPGEDIPPAAGGAGGRGSPATEAPARRIAAGPSRRAG